MEAEGKQQGNEEIAKDDVQKAQRQEYYQKTQRKEYYQKTQRQENVQKS